jgi:hypothetical protein
MVTLQYKVGSVTTLPLLMLKTYDKDHAKYFHTQLYSNKAVRHKRTTIQRNEGSNK